jgi:hypothetical protein
MSAVQRAETHREPPKKARLTQARGVLRALVALVILNALLSMTTVWPTPWARPDVRVAPEFIWTWILLLGVTALAARWRISPTLWRRVLIGVAVAYTALVIGRYIDITIPSMFGRGVNLLWDVPQLPRAFGVWAQGAPRLQVLGTLALIVLVPAVLATIVHRCLRVATQDALPYALRTPWVWALTVAAAALAVANHAGVQATWPYVSKPVVPTFWQQTKTVITALSTRRAAAVLPPVPVLDAALASAMAHPPDGVHQVLPALRGQDVVMMMLETYGAVTYDNAAMNQRMLPARERFMADLAAGGKHVVSAFLRSPTFAGGTDLAHLTALSGVDLSDPLRHDVLLYNQRPTLISLFKKLGYQTFGVYASVSWDWPERKYYGFDVYLDARELAYPGPRLGYWWIPDQYTAAKFDVLHPRTAASPPRFVFFPTITTHMPFSPVPPFQPDWQRVLHPEPFDAAATEAAQAKKPNWMNMADDYVSMFEYTHTWLGSYLRRPEPRDTVHLLIGDHQPAANVTGEGASWDVPVHVVSRDRALLDRFKALGFAEGMNPPRPNLGGLHRVPDLVLQAMGAAVPRQ